MIEEYSIAQSVQSSVATVAPTSPDLASAAAPTDDAFDGLDLRQLAGGGLATQIVASPGLLELASFTASGAPAT